MILVKNVYYMLAYVFTSLQGKAYKNMSGEEFDNIADLLAAILTKGINQQVRQGLKRDYVEVKEQLSALRGKFELTESLKCSCLMQGKLICTHDEFSLNTKLNRIVKTAGLMLLNSDACIARKKSLCRALDYLSDVEPYNPKSIDWKNRLDRNSDSYKMLLFVCKLIIDGMLLNNNDGKLRLGDFSEPDLAHLFERFVLEYFRREHAATVSANAPTIEWALDDENSELLPTMRTDITLIDKNNPNNALIIDTKFYGSILQTHFDKRTIRSNNLYQIFTYVKNMALALQQSFDNPKVQGMLLYAKTTADIQPDAVYQMSGTPISVKTLDLNQSFDVIRSQLDSLLKLFAY